MTFDPGSERSEGKKKRDRAKQPTRTTCAVTKFPNLTPADEMAEGYKQIPTGMRGSKKRNMLGLNLRKNANFTSDLRFSMVGPELISNVISGPLSTRRANIVEGIPRNLAGTEMRQEGKPSVFTSP